MERIAQRLADLPLDASRPLLQTFVVKLFGANPTACEALQTIATRQTNALKCRGSRNRLRVLEGISVLSRDKLCTLVSGLCKAALRA